MAITEPKPTTTVMAVEVETVMAAEVETVMAAELEELAEVVEAVVPSVGSS